jgi:glycosyltransferase involved in cell wall biosynthesis
MKISIFTPTHNPKYIPELWESIKAQTHIDWEWVIVANNGAKIDIEDNRIVVINTPYGIKSVGALKKFACENCSGDILLEVDHDDILTPDALSEVDKAFENQEVGFVYSNNAKLGDFIPYNKDYGWEHKTFEYQDRKLHCPIDFEPTAHSLAFIWFAPDHLRAWRKSVYFEVGGHNPDLDILDDHDLLIRTYLKTKFKLIDKCLYIYRIYGENTWLERNARIQSGTVDLYNKYAYQLAERWADLQNLKKIDLGGGFNSPEGYLSVDLKNASVEANLDEKWPFEDNSVGVIRAHDIFEHLKDKQHAMSEAYRVLADGGWLLVSVPSTDGRGAFQDPTHISYWNENSFWYWTRRDLAKYIHNDTVKFQEFRLETIFPTDWHKKHNIPYVVANLAAIKSDKRRPHLQLI